MSLIRLTAKIDANATQFHSAIKGVENRATVAGRMVGAQLRSAFLYFAGFSGISRLIRGMDDMIENIDDMRPRMRQLGIEVDEALIQNAKKARAEWEQLTMSIKVGLLPSFSFLLRQTVELLYAFRAIAQIGEAFSLRKLVTTSPKETYEELKRVQDQLKSSLKGMGLAQPGTKPIKDMDKAEKEKVLSEAMPKMFSESLAKIGGFTGRAGEELKSIQFRQLQKLERIETNTEPLKRGIG